MTPVPRERRVHVAAAAAAFAVTLAIRLTAYVELGSDLAVSMPVLDGRWNLDAARGLLSQGGWGPEPFFMAPLYPHLLAPALAAAEGHAVELQRAIQIAVGLGTWLLMVILAWRRISPGAGVAAGWILALAGPPILYENLLIVDPWLALALAALLVLEPGERGCRAHRAAAMGGLAALAALGRPSYLLLGPLVCLRMWTAGVGLRRRMRLAAVSVAAWLILLAPVAVHNLAAGAAGTLVSTNGGVNLYLGFHEGSSGGFHYPVELTLTADPSGRDAAELLAGRPLSSAEASRFWAERALQWMVDHPVATLRLELRKLGLWLSSAEQPQIEVFPVMRRRHPILRAAPLHFGWFLAIGAVGLAREARRGRFLSRWGFWMGLLAICWLTSMATFSVGRFRLPTWWLLSPPAGGGIALLASSARTGAARRLAAGIAGAAGVLAASLLMPRTDLPDAAAFFHQNLAQRHLLRQENQRALEEAQAGLAFNPRSGSLLQVKGLALERLGRMEEAISAYEASLATLGRHPRTLHRLGAVHGLLGHHETALACLREAARLRPRDPQLLADLGIALRETGHGEEALRIWRRAREMTPGDPRIDRLIREALEAREPPGREEQPAADETGAEPF